MTYTTRQVLPTPRTMPTSDIAYHRARAERIALDLIREAAAALAEGRDMYRPHIALSTPTEDAITAQSLTLLARTIRTHMEQMEKGPDTTEPLRKDTTNEQ
ncbi:hypothetical protein [Bifidobacterium cuniculi]|uniref:Uncharacterized protein n=1 Tax=Bifidobacterium cuniculi TaxID=1688 RepID=A0A087AHS2_9BIFI|nr:hypothetical protein [Bifidobacterium cuniculi]KFI58322.1 hypothetical protein BCUN_1923 [Bifidobacterium cuniculi]